MKTKKLKKSRNNRILTGVLGGIAEYFGWNARYLRIVYLIITVLMIHTMVPILIYLVLIVLMPNNYGKYDNFFDSARQTNPHSNHSNGRKVLHDVEERDDPKSKE